jgi:hypothetical protein
LGRNAKKAREEMIRHVQEVERNLIAIQKKRSFQGLNFKRKGDFPRRIVQNKGGGYRSGRKMGRIGF